MLEGGSVQAANLWVPGAHVRGLQHHVSAPVHGMSHTSQPQDMEWATCLSPRTWSEPHGKCMDDTRKFYHNVVFSSDHTQLLNLKKGIYKSFTDLHKVLPTNLHSGVTILHKVLPFYTKCYHFTQSVTILHKVLPFYIKCYHFTQSVTILHKVLPFYTGCYFDRILLCSILFFEQTTVMTWEWQLSGRQSAKWFSEYIFSQETWLWMRWNSPLYQSCRNCLGLAKDFHSVFCLLLKEKVTKYLCFYVWCPQCSY